MNQKNPTKYYSSKQEKTIADYLGWSVVVASGARPFNPGDIKSDEYLCECKTHTTIKSRICIKETVWKKICLEADCSFKKPVLFIDNGSQKVDDTWCIIRKPKVINNLQVFPIHDTIVSKGQTSFKHELFLSALKDGSCFEFILNSESLLLMKLETFKILIQEL